jgi:EAL domain-containing protein (putative c-di-GMP-specific phosphodiesterase class I)
VQGFYFSKPVQASEVQAVLSRVQKRLASAPH